MQFIADLHIHSRYSRATSKDATPENLYRWALYKGVTLVGSGDFTHPAWREELKNKLEPAEDGLYRLKEEFSRPVDEEPGAGPAGPGKGARWPADMGTSAGWFSSIPSEASGRPAVRFIISGEISTIYKKNGRVRKIHHLILLPDLEAAEDLSRRLEEIGNLHSDGRPILGLDSRQLLEMTLETCPEAVFIPAHIWTPHFSLFGAKSGFDSLEECFGDLAGYIYAVETGLSSDPPMNWRLAALDRLTLVSNSDAHSPRNLAREANLFNTELSYPAIREALRDRDGKGFQGTLEFFPEEGKYHYDGHRNCRVRWRPAQTREAGGVCPVCGKRVTVGVLHRVEELADRGEGFRPATARPFESLVPLPEVIAAALGSGVATKRVTRLYFDLIGRLGPELAVLREAPLEAIARVGGSLVAEAIRRMRTGEVDVQPGFDGEYGKILLLRPEERQLFSGEPSLFAGEAVTGPVAAIEEKHPEIGATGPAGATLEEAGAGRQGEIFAPQVPAGRRTRHPETAASAVIRPTPVPAGSGGPGLTGALNPEQQSAVTAATGPVVVIAGPGTGKTRTLVYRLAYLIKERGVAPGEIAAVTFTNKAAAEIRQRVADLLGDRDGMEALTVGTFHSICLDLLQSSLTGSPGADLQGKPVGTTDTLASPRLTVVDEADAREILAGVLAEKGTGRRGLPGLQRRISLLKSRGLLPDSPEVPADLRPIYRAYQERLAAYGVLDYDDILLKALELPALRPAGAPAFQGPVPFTHLLVDEFQDVNAVQYRLVKKWTGDGKNLFVIGDPDQAIYGFRGADYRFFGQLLEDFPAARVFRLTRNYRSTPVILRAAAAVVAHNPGGGLREAAGGELAATTASTASPAAGPGISGAGGLVATRPEGGPILHLEAPGETAAGIAIVREIGRLVGGATMLQAHGQDGGAWREGPETGSDGAYGFSDIAVLCRTGHQLKALEECFLKEGLPYRIVGRESFLEERPVREALAFCRCLVNPEDDFHLLKYLGSGAAGAGEEVAKRVRETALKRGVPAWLVIRELAGELQNFISSLEAYRAALDKQSPAELLARWAGEHGLLDEPSINRLLRVAERFPDLSAFLRGVVLAGEADHERPGNNGASPEVVTLMTLHAAKGLEFPAVFIAGVEDGLLPLKEGPGVTLSPEEMAEERRLFYVGMTRARELLVLVSSRRRELRGTVVPAEPSPFLGEIPADCLVRETWDARSKKKSGEDEEKYQQLSLF
ncbi:ATP-dependent DNA helicase PcrA [Moorella thermoacetica]|uniref:DNA 3'-5' helicase n=1 Tax=Neomoorella thermoacetica TaxID=1525 RepID=A0A1J5NZI4_NEOTH|nr:ATP-dependent DNA helicase PcrA [Moorella thermoacetica]